MLDSVDPLMIDSNLMSVNCVDVWGVQIQSNIGKASVEKEDYLYSHISLV